jgi:hypothetical protein
MPCAVGAKPGWIMDAWKYQECDMAIQQLVCIPYSVQLRITLQITDLYGWRGT